jgi:hypothetical protein
MTSATLTKAMLQQLAEAGVLQRVADLERELAIYHKVWPDVFISATAPQLLKAMPKATSGSTNGHWPVTTFTKTKTKTTTKHAASWSPERRAAASKEVKARWKKGVYKSKVKKSKKTKTTNHGNAGLVDRIHAYLQQHGESDLKAMVTGTGYTGNNGPASIVSTMQRGLKSGRFKRTGKGRYALGPKA